MKKKVEVRWWGYSKGFVELSKKISYVHRTRLYIQLYSNGDTVRKSPDKTALRNRRAANSVYVLQYYTKTKKKVSKDSKLHIIFYYDRVKFRFRPMISLTFKFPNLNTFAFRRISLIDSFTGHKTIYMTCN